MRNKSAKQIEARGRPAADFPTPVVASRGASFLVRWTYSRKKYDLNLGAVTAREAAVRCAEVAMALASGRADAWPAWARGASSVERYLEAARITPRVATVSPSAAAGDRWIDAHLAALRAARRPEKVIGHARRCLYALRARCAEWPHATRSEVEAWLEEILTTPSVWPGAAAEIAARMAGAGAFSIGDAMAAVSAPRKRVARALCERRDLFRRTRKGVYRVRDDLAGGGGRSNATRNRALSAARPFFRTLLERGEIRENPCAGVRDLAEEMPEEIDYFDAAERDRVTAAADRAGDGLAWRLACDAGLRLGEIARLDWRDVHLDTRWLQVGHVRRARSKTRRARTVPIMDRLLAVLEAVPKRRRRGPVVPELAAADRPEDWSKESRKRLRAALPDLGSRVTFLTARHTFCSLLAQSGKYSLDQIAGIAGHTPEVCRRYYAHLLPRDAGSLPLDVL